MSSFFNSAMDYVQKAVDTVAGDGTEDGGGASANSGLSNSYVGRTVTVGGKRFRVLKLLAEGGYAYVFLVEAEENGNLYAMKRLMVPDGEYLKKTKTKRNHDDTGNCKKT